MTPDQANHAQEKQMHHTKPPRNTRLCFRMIIPKPQSSRRDSIQENTHSCFHTRGTNHRPFTRKANHATPAASLAVCLHGDTRVPSGTARPCYCCPHPRQSLPATGIDLTPQESAHPVSGGKGIPLQGPLLLMAVNNGAEKSFVVR